MAKISNIGPDGEPELNVNNGEIPEDPINVETKDTTSSAKTALLKNKLTFKLKDKPISLSVKKIAISGVVLLGVLYGLGQGARNAGLAGGNNEECSLDIGKKEVENEIDTYIQQNRKIDYDAFVDINKKTRKSTRSQIRRSANCPKNHVHKIENFRRTQLRIQAENFGVDLPG